MMRIAFYVVSFLGLAAIVAFAPQHPWLWWGLAVMLPYIAVGVHDMNQKTRALLRNYPVIGHGRYVMELVRPEIQQYFVESNLDGRPFHRNERSIVYQRAKGVIETMPFGTQSDVTRPGTNGSITRLLLWSTCARNRGWLSVASDAQSRIRCRSSMSLRCLTGP